MKSGDYFFDLNELHSTTSDVYINKYLSKNLVAYKTFCNSKRSENNCPYVAFNGVDRYAITIIPKCLGMLLWS